MYRKLLKKSYFIFCIVYLLRNLMCMLRMKFGNIETSSGTIHFDKDIDSSLVYIKEVFEDYKRYSRIERFYGRVVELGPGDNCGVGLLFLKDGCESVDLVDRFYSRRDIVKQSKIYRELIFEYGSLYKRFGHLDVLNEDSFEGITRHYGKMAAAEIFFNKHKDYDFIVSRAVLEHIYDPYLAIKGMAAALKPGGMLIHKVDLRDHGLFSDNFHEMKFLEVPDYLYHWMTRYSGYPNRFLVNRYRSILSATSLDYQILVTRLAGVGEIIPHLPYEQIEEPIRKKSLEFIQGIRHRFAHSMTDVSDEDLSITGCFIIAKK